MFIFFVAVCSASVQEMDAIGSRALPADVQTRSGTCPYVVPSAALLQEKVRHRTRAPSSSSSSINYLTPMAVEGFIELDNSIWRDCQGGQTLAEVTSRMYVPGCQRNDRSPICASPCYDFKIFENIDRFNEENPGQIVNYTSRHGKGKDGIPLETITLRGWWLPAPISFGNNTPRIVMQHGFTGFSNDYTVQVVAFMLRSIGFGVLLNNFRDHCYSDNSTAHTNEWGHAYPYDLLGAWDYAREDPDGILGGSRPASMVGLQGNSKGGFTVLTALGLDGHVPAAWVDAPALSPKNVFAHNSRKKLSEMYIPSFISERLIDPVWSNVESEALSRGIDLNENLPLEVLPRGPQTARPLYVVHNRDDDTVPFSELDSLVNLVNRHPGKYELNTYVTEGLCHGNPHIKTSLQYHQEYLLRLCNFWTSAFGLNETRCGL